MTISYVRDMYFRIMCMEEELTCCMHEEFDGISDDDPSVPDTEVELMHGKLTKAENELRSILDTLKPHVTDEFAQCVDDHIEAYIHTTEFGRPTWAYEENSDD